MKFTGERLVPFDEICGPETEIYKEHITRYEFAHRFIKTGDTVLDIACGSGYGTKLLANVKNSHIYGCDISKDAIEYAEKHYHGNNIIYEIQNISKLKYSDNFFDCIVCFETIEHVPDYEKAIKEFTRVLKKNGILIISTPNKDVTQNYEENEFHYHEFSKNEFTTLLTRCFQNLRLYSQKLIFEPPLTEKIQKKAIQKMIKVSKRIPLNLKRKFVDKGTGQKMYDSINSIKPDIILYEAHHNPQNFIVICNNKN